MRLLGVITLLLITGCASVPMYNDSCSTRFAQEFGEWIEAPEIIQLQTYEQLVNFPRAEGMPVVVIRGFKSDAEKQKATALIRDREMDMFR